MEYVFFTRLYYNYIKCLNFVTYLRADDTLVSVYPLFTASLFRILKIMYNHRKRFEHNSWKKNSILYLLVYFSNIHRRMIRHMDTERTYGHMGARWSGVSRNVVYLQIFVYQKKKSLKGPLSCKYGSSDSFEASIYIIYAQSFLFNFIHT